MGHKHRSHLDLAHERRHPHSEAEKTLTLLLLSDMRRLFHGYNLLRQTPSLRYSLLKLLSEDSDSTNPPPVISSRRYGTFLTEI
jgi:hypothetical protein